MPVPSMAVMRFALSPGFAEPLLVKRGAQLSSKPIGGVSCIYSTMQDITVLPLTVASVESETRSDMSGSVTLTLRAAAPLEKFLPDRLDFHLTGAYSLASQRLLALLTRLESIKVSAGTASAELPPSALSMLRPPLEDQRLPQGQARNRAYAALVRYFCCPEQLAAFGVSGLKRLALTESASELKLTFRFGKGVTQLPPSRMARSQSTQSRPATCSASIPSRYRPTLPRGIQDLSARQGKAVRRRPRRDRRDGDTPRRARRALPSYGLLQRISRRADLQRPLHDAGGRAGCRSIICRCRAALTRKRASTAASFRWI